MGFEHRYSDTFYKYIEQGSLRSASGMLPVVLSNITLSSVVDLGCGRGAWLTVFKKLGVNDIFGIDGDYVSGDDLLIEKKEFASFNLSEHIDLPRKFELVMSLEVAEHLPEESSDRFVKNLTKLGDVILFSAAVVGQGGEHHVNEKPLEFWKAKFESEGYSCYDFIRDIVRDDKTILPWYRYNVLVYANTVGKNRLSDTAKSALVPAGQKIANVQSLMWNLRLFITRQLPVNVATLLAQLNSHWIALKTR